MAGITLDVATLRAANRILTCPRDTRHDQGRFLDLDLAALGNVVEAIVLFDDILVPDLGHSDLAALLQPFGPAIRIWSVSTAARQSIATQARQWMASWNNIEAFIRVLGASPLYANVGGGTFWYLVLEAVGARDKYQSNVIQLLRSMWSYDQEFATEMPTVIYNDRWYQDPNQAISNYFEYSAARPELYRASANR